MAFLSNIFGSQAAQSPAPAPVPAGTAIQQATGPANPAANPVNMPTGPAAAPAGGPINPLDAYANLFTPKAVDPKAPKEPSLSDPILGAFDPAAFRTQVATANFAAHIPHDQMQKALSGDVAAFSDVINMATREAFAAATQLSHGLIEQGVRTGAERVTNGLDSRIRNSQVKSQNTSNAALSHPAVAPMLNAVKAQIAASNPNLSPAEIQVQSEQYFTQMAEVLIAPKQAAAEAARKPTGTDFSSYLQ